MHTLALISQKGGAGKTTLAVNLAAYAHSQGQSVAIADIDAQASSCVWFDARESDNISVVSCQPTRLKAVLDAARNECDLCIIDTSPNSESATLAAARAADFALIPCRPSLQDIEAIRMTIELVAIAKTPSGIVINATKNKSIAQDATTAVSTLGLPVAPVTIGDRVGFSHAFTSGLGVCEYEPSNKGSNEIRQLYTWVMEQINTTA